MHLRPRSIRDNDNQLKSLPPLPVDKTAVQVFADYLKYLFQCSKAYIEETQPNGADFWASVQSNIDYVLSHPNGWEGLQQTQMRKAIVLAGLVPNTPMGDARISFVTEGEASLHFAIQHGLPDGVTKVSNLTHWVVWNNSSYQSLDREMMASWLSMQGGVLLILAHIFANPTRSNKFSRKPPHRNVSFSLRFQKRLTISQRFLTWIRLRQRQAPWAPERYLDEFLHA